MTTYLSSVTAISRTSSALRFHCGTAWHQRIVARQKCTLYLAHPATTKAVLRCSQSGRSTFSCSLQSANAAPRKKQNLRNESLTFFSKEPRDGATIRLERERDREGGRAVTCAGSDAHSPARHLTSGPTVTKAAVAIRIPAYHTP